MPNAISVPVSQTSSGNDGLWSTFALQLGSNGTKIQVLASSSGSSVWAVNATYCQGWPSDQSECSTMRGGVFDPSTSTSYQPIHNETNGFFFGLPDTAEEALPGWSGSGVITEDVSVGQDTVGLGWDSGRPILDSQVIVSLLDPVPWVGFLGLKASPENITQEKADVPSPLQTLQTNKAIPSLFWAYNAGAQYRSPYTSLTSASLTLGGYDKTRGNVAEAPKISLNANDDTRDLTVFMPQASIENKTYTIPLNTSLYAFIDSVVSDIWLPEWVCSFFEHELGIVWDADLAMYLLNDTQVTQMLGSQDSVTFSIAASNDSAGSEWANITLPLAAFVKNATYPVANITNLSSSQPYFALRQSSGLDPNYLGRTFLQESYLAVDYDRHEFSLSPALWPSPQSEPVPVTVYPPGFHSITASDIAGIVVGIVLALVLACFALRYCAGSRWQKFVGIRRRSTLSSRWETVNRGLPESQKSGFWAQLGHRLGPDDYKDLTSQELEDTTTARGSVGDRAELDNGSTYSRQSPRHYKGNHSREGSYGFYAPVSCVRSELESFAAAEMESPPLDQPPAFELAANTARRPSSRDPLSPADRSSPLDAAGGTEETEGDTEEIEDRPPGSSRPAEAANV